MNKIFFILAVMISLLVSPQAAFAYNSDDSDESGTSGALTGAVMGGLLGGGLGAAIGSASGNAGKGALIGAGVGAVGGTLVGASQKPKRTDDDYYYAEEPTRVQTQDVEAAKETTVKKRVIRQYDEDGNVIAEKEVAR